MSPDGYTAALEAAMRTVQLSAGYEDRQILLGIITKAMRENGLGPSLKAPADLASTLRDTGLARLDPLVTPEQARQIREYLESRPAFASHVAARSDGVPRSFIDARQFPKAAYWLEDVLAAPLLLEIANRPQILALAEAYLGCVPTLYSINAVWTFAGGEVATQTFHRDYDDFRFCALFVLLTDTHPGDGSHHFAEGSHLSETQQPDGVNNFAEIHGPAGTSFMADTFGLHRGAPCASDRLLFWARYGVYLNSTYHDNGMHPVRVDRFPNDPYLAYVNRGIVRS